MKVCLFGSDPEGYNRNISWIKALASKDVKVEECLDSKSHFITKPFKLIKRYFSNHKDCDCIIVGGFSHTNMPIAYLLGKIFKVPVIFAPLYSRFDTNVRDRKLVKQNSLKAKIEWCIDWLSAKLSDILLLDTRECMFFYNREFKVPKSKIRQSWIGTDEEIYIPRNIKKNNKKIKVFYFGNFIPLHGVQYIIEAANILKNNQDIEFILLGAGQELEEILDLVKKSKLDNIKFLPPVSAKKLADFLSEIDIGLGVFGSSDKASRHIPNKIFQVIAMGKPLVTAKTEAILEAFEDRNNCFLCNKSDGESLAKAIEYLSRNLKIREEIALNGRRLFEEKFSRDVIGECLKEIIVESIDSKK